MYTIMNEQIVCSCGYHAKGKDLDEQEKDIINHHIKKRLEGK